MNKYFALTLKIILFIVFVWLARSFWGFNEVDGCLDDGGVVSDGICIGSRHGQWALASNKPFLSWLVALGIPAIAIWVMHSLIHRFVSKG